MMIFANILQNLSVISACISVMLGINAWRREFIGKRKIELAEDVLTRFYEAKDAIARIRNPVALKNESEGRTRDSSETQEKSELLDQAYVVFSRYEKEQELFNRIHVLRYSTMARLGVEAAIPFEELHRIINKILHAARMLGRYYWPRQGRVQMSQEEFDKHLKEMHEYESIIWGDYDETDHIQKSVDGVIKQIEDICRPVLEKTPVGFIQMESFYRIFKRK